MQNMEVDIEMFRKAVSAFAAKEYEVALPLIQQLLEKYPNNTSIIKLKINELTKVEKMSNHIDELKTLINHGIEAAPEDGDFEKYRLDIEFENNREETLLAYVDAWYNTYNGLIRLDIMDIIEANLDFYFDYCDKNIKAKDEEENFVSIVLIDKLNEIVQDNHKIIEKKFDILKSMADSAENPVEKAEQQHKLITCILDVLKKYNFMFRENKYQQIETVVTKWYYKCYKQINKSDFVTQTSAEIIACEDFNQLNMILEKLDKHMEELDKNSQEYLYCLELRGKSLYLRGESRSSGKVLIKCAKDNNDPYLNQLLKDDFNVIISDIYGKMYYSYNSCFTNKYSEVSGLEPEEAYRKNVENKKRLVRFYKKDISKICSSANTFIGLLVKIGTLTQSQANSIIKKCNIKKDTGFNFKIITEICSYIEEIDTTIDDRDWYLEEISSRMYPLYKPKENDHSIFVV
jgi:hypothetical protein